MSYQAYPSASYQAPPSTSYAYPPPSQPSYNNHPPAPPPVQQLGYPPPIPQYQSVEHFRAHYAGRLRELTFNSRPLIQELSVSAMHQRDAGNWDFMRVIVEEVEAATVRAHPEAKLPLLYLIDSISKNVGRPFTTQLLPPVLPRLYIYTYRQVNGTTRAKMEEMVALWRTSGPNRDDLYGPAVRQEVEAAIFGSRAALGPGGGVGGGHPSQPQVIQMVNGRIQAKQAESSQRPWEERLRHEIAVLQQIAQLLATTQISGPELQRIADDLGQNSSAVPPPSLPPPTVPPMPMAHSPIPGYPAPQSAGPSRPPPTNLPPFAPTLSRESLQAPIPHPQHNLPPLPNLPTPSQSISTPVPNASTPIPAPIPIPAVPTIAAGIPANVADILRNLNTSGLLSNPRTPEITLSKSEAKQKSAFASYEEMILSLDVRLESLDLNKMSALPTSHLPQRCKQCGIRFPDGDAKMQAHMDWHFRRNRKERETEGRGAHRRWLPRAEEWVSDFSNTNEAGPSTKSPVGGKNASAPTSLPAEKIAAYRKKWVRVPTDSTKANSPCPICKEMWKSEWSEEEEEWVWRNAVDVNGTIYHATCRAEQMFAKKVQKMLNPEGRRSTSKSPRITPQPNESSAAVKTEHFDSHLKHEEGREGTPGSAAGKRKAEGGEEREGVREVEAKRVKVEDEEAVAAEPAVPEAQPELPGGAGEVNTIDQVDQPAEGDLWPELKQEQQANGDDIQLDGQQLADNGNEGINEAIRSPEQADVPPIPTQPAEEVENSPPGIATDYSTSGQAEVPSPPSDPANTTASPPVAVAPAAAPDASAPPQEDEDDPEMAAIYGTGA